MLLSKSQCLGQLSDQSSNFLEVTLDVEMVVLNPRSPTVSGFKGNGESPQGSRKGP